MRDAPKPREGSDSIRKFLFLALGLTRGYPPGQRDGMPLEEPDGARSSRRNIIGLGGMLALAGLAGVNPGDLNVFGMKLGEGARGVMVIAASAVAVQLYWYYLRYCHLRDDVKVTDRPNSREEALISMNVIRGGSVSFEHKTANLASNWVAFSLTIVSWCFIVYWIIGVL